MPAYIRVRHSITEIRVRQQTSCEPPHQLRLAILSIPPPHNKNIEWLQQSSVAKDKRTSDYPNLKRNGEEHGFDVDACAATVDCSILLFV